MKYIGIKAILVVSFLIGFSSLQASYTDLDLAAALSKTYPDLALKLLKKADGPLNDQSFNKEQKERVNEIAADVYGGLLKYEKDPEKRKEFEDLKRKHFALSNPSQMKLAKSIQKDALLTGIKLKEFTTPDKDKPSIRAKSSELYLKAAVKFKTLSDKYKKPFTEGYGNLLDVGFNKFRKTEAGKKWLKDIYPIYSDAVPSYIECYVDRAELYPNGAPERLKDMESLSERASDFSFECEAPAPMARAQYLEGTIYGFLSEGSKDPKEFAEKSLDTLNDLLATEAPSNRTDKRVVNYFKIKACHSLTRFGLRQKKYDYVTEAINAYTKGLMKSGKFSLVDYEILLNGLVAHTHLFVASKDAKHDVAYKNLLKILEKNAKAPYWQRKILNVKLECASIRGEEISDPKSLIDIANEKNKTQKYEEAVVKYEEAFTKKFTRIQAIKLKPKAYYSLAYCYYKLKKFDKSRDALEKFFDEFKHDDPRYVKLKKEFERCAKLRTISAGNFFKQTQDPKDYDKYQEAIDIEGIFDPDAIKFKKADALSKGGNYIDALKMLRSVKENNGDYDKALYLLGLYGYKYCNAEKKKNDGVHTDVSKAVGNDSIVDLNKYIAFVDGDDTELIPEVVERRKKWKKESKKLLGIIYVSLGKYKESVKLLEGLYDTYSKNEEDKKHSNMYFVLQSLYTSYSSLINDTNQKAFSKKDLVAKTEALLNKFKKLDKAVFAKSYDDPKKKLDDTIKNYKKRVGAMLMKYGKEINNKEMIQKGLDILRSSSNDVSPRYLATELYKLGDFGGAASFYEEVIKELKQEEKDKGMSKKDFSPVLAELSDDADKSFLKKYFRKLAVKTKIGPDDKNKNPLKNRDYSKFYKRMKYILEPKEKYENESAADKADRLKIQKKGKTRNWKKENFVAQFKILKERMYGHLTYLGVIDDLINCYKKTGQFDLAIKNMEIMNKAYPGIISEDKKLYDFKLEYVKKLIEDKGDVKVIKKNLSDSLAGYVYLKKRLKSKSEEPIFFDVNQKRLECYLLDSEVNKNEESFKRVMQSLTLIYPDQTAYIKYGNICAMLKKREKLPDSLVPLTPEELRLKNKKDAEDAKRLQEEEEKNRAAKEDEEFKLNSSKAVGKVYTFFPTEFRNANETEYKKYYAYYMSLANSKKPTSKGNPNLALKNLFNEVMMKIEMYKELPEDALKAKGASAVVDEIKKLIEMKPGELKFKVIRLNRKLLNICFPALPKMK